MNGVVAIGVVTEKVVAKGMVCRRADLEVVIMSTAIEAVAGVVAKVKPWLASQIVSHSRTSRNVSRQQLIDKPCRGVQLHKVNIAYAKPGMRLC
jgi:hypothetical protein